MTLLETNGFDADLPTYVIWEGNTMYLTSGDVRRILAELNAGVRDVRISFDYMADAVIAKTTGDAGVTSLVESFANMGARWLSGIRDIDTLARELGFRVVDNRWAGELARTNEWKRPLTSAIFDLYAVCTLQALPKPPA